VVVNLRTKRQLVSRILRVGLGRVKFDPEYLDDVADAITRDNIRSLITANVIQIKPIKGTSKGRAYFKKLQRRKRGTKQGSKKGSIGARVGKKEVYVNKIRAMRYRLKVLKSRKEVRNLAHLRTLIEEVRSKK